MADVMSYAADRTEDAEQAAPLQPAPQTADPAESVVEVTVATPTEVPPAVVDLARSAAVAEAGEPAQIGEHLDTIAEDAVARTVRFAALDPGYRGWQWSVTVAVLPDEPVTVSEVVLLPGPDALIAPPWLPWDQRLRPGDLGPTDLLPAADDDVRLAPGYVESDDPAVEALATEVGLGRERVLSREGRDDAAERWHDGPFGPTSPTAKAAPAACGTCGFFTPLAGSLGGAFGVCANEFSPADARVVDVAFGCGAHSEVPAPPPAVPVGATALDEVTLEVHPRPAAAVADSDASPVEADAPESPGDTDDAADEVAGLTAVPDKVPVDDAVAVDPEAVSVAGEVAGADAEIVLSEPVADIAEPQSDAGIVLSTPVADVADPQSEAGIVLSEPVADVADAQPEAADRFAVGEADAQPASTPVADAPDVPAVTDGAAEDAAVQPAGEAELVAETTDEARSVDPSGDEPAAPAAEDPSAVDPADG